MIEMSSAGTYPRDFSALLRDHTFSTDNFSSQHERTQNINSTASSEGKGMTIQRTDEEGERGPYEYCNLRRRLNVD